MTRLRQAVLDELQRRNYSESTNPKMKAFTFAGSGWNTMSMIGETW